MKTFTQVYAALRRKNKGRHAFLTGCCFFSVLLITAYACMMRSPTILSVLPEGGDSRKPVSYTHLDVYKRQQPQYSPGWP